MIKFFYKSDTIFDYLPSFIFGKSGSTNRFNFLTSDNLNDSHFISFISPYREVYGECEFLFERIKEVKSINPKIKILAVWKDEIIQTPQYDKLHNVFKMLIENNIFDKSEILVFSPNINTDVKYEYFVHASTYLSPTHYMIPRVFFEQNGEEFLKSDLYPDDDGRYFGTKPILENRIDIQKEKKILSSARKWNHYRGTFYEKLLIDYYDLINDDNIIRFYDFNSNSTLPSKFGKRTYYELFPHNEPQENVENELMQDCEERYYEPLVRDYLKSYVSVVHETCFPDFQDDNKQYEKYLNQYHLTEKTLIPIACKCIFFTNTHSDFDFYLQKVGIKTFTHFFTSNDVLEILDEINSWDMKKLKEFYNRDDVQENINHNFKLWKNWMDLFYRDTQVQKELYEYFY